MYSLFSSWLFAVSLVFGRPRETKVSRNSSYLIFSGRFIRGVAPSMFLRTNFSNREALPLGDLITRDLSIYVERDSQPLRSSACESARDLAHDLSKFAICRVFSGCFVRSKPLNLARLATDSGRRSKILLDRAFTTCWHRESNFSFTNVIRFWIYRLTTDLKNRPRRGRIATRISEIWFESRFSGKDDGEGAPNISALSNI